MKTGREQSVIPWIIVVLGLAVLCWFAPLFHLRPLKASQEQTASTAFNAPMFVAKFWDERLVKSLAKAMDARILIDAIKKDPQQARTKSMGETMGLSSTYYYFVAGTGKVVGVGRKFRLSGAG